MPQLPQELYVYWNTDDDESPFLLVEEELEDAAESAGEETLVGTYVLEHKAKYGIDKTITEL